MFHFRKTNKKTHVPTMIKSKSIIIIFTLLISIDAKCIWYEGIREGLNEIYPNGEPKALPLSDVTLLNEMCPHIPTSPGSTIEN